MKRIAPMLLLATLFPVSMSGRTPQQAVPPPPRPADSGPSLADTMNFIQDKLNAQGRVGYVRTQSNLTGLTYRQFYTISNVVADPATCTLRKEETNNTQIEIEAGREYREGGKLLAGEDLVRTQVETSTVHLKDIKDLSVAPMQDEINRGFAQAAHPEISASITPEVFYLKLNGNGQVFTFHVVYTVGHQTPQTRESSSDADTLTIRDADTADRLAKAFTHAVELCGGGSKDPF